MSSSFTFEVAVALQTAQAAAEQVLQIYGRDFTVHDKGQGDPITEADRRSNDFIIARLRAEFPNDSICDEEGPLEAASAAAARGGRCWFVDPLDGTREFVRRSGEFCTMIGLAVAGRPVLGVVCAPVWRRTFVGIVEQDAYELDAAGSRRPLRVTSTDDNGARPTRLVLSRPHRNAEVLAAASALEIHDLRECGSVGLKMMLVASGEVDLYLHTGPGPSLWDGCAPEAIVVAAGGVVTDVAGAALRYDTAHLPLDRGIVVGGRPLVERAAAALQRDALRR